MAPIRRFARVLVVFFFGLCAAICLTNWWPRLELLPLLFVAVAVAATSAWVGARRAYALKRSTVGAIIVALITFFEFLRPSRVPIDHLSVGQQRWFWLAGLVMIALVIVDGFRDSLREHDRNQSPH